MLLDALTYILSADNSDLNKEIDQSEKKVDEFGKSLTSAEGRAKLMEDKIKGAFLGIGGTILAAVAASKALGAAAERAAFIQQINDVSEASGAAVEDVDALGKSVELLGGDAQGAQGSLQNLAKSAYDAMQDANGSQAKAFAALKISLKGADGQIKSTTALMGDLAQAVQGKDRRKAEDMLAGVGITDRKTIDLLFKGKQTMEDLMRAQKAQGVVTKESVEKAQQYSLAMAKLKQSMGAARDGVSEWLLPALTWVIDKFDQLVRWFSSHKKLVEGFFIALATVLTVTFLPAVLSAATGVWALIAPFLAVAVPIGAVIALFALLYDDVMNFLDGNESLIGQISEKYPIVGETVRAMAEAVKTAFGWIGEASVSAWDAIKIFASAVLEALSPLSGAFGGAFGAIMQLAESFVGLFGGIIGKIVNLLGGDLSGAFKGTGDVVALVMNGIVSTIKVAVGIITSMLNVASAAVSGIASAISSVAGWLGIGDGGNIPKTGPAPPGVAATSEPFADSVPPATSVPQSTAVPDVAAGASENMRTARSSLDVAASNPMNSITSNAISNTNNARTENNVQVGQVTVQTQATDAQGISQSIGSELSDQLKNLQSDSASGVAR